MIRRPQVKFERITSTNTEQPSQADFKVTNGRNKTIKILEINIIPNLAFIQNGHLVIEVEDEPTLIDIGSSNFTDLETININFKEIGGAEFLRNNSIKIFIWNENNSNSIACTCSIILGE